MTAEQDCIIVEIENLRHCMAAAPALRGGEKVIDESYHKGLYTRLSTYQGDQYIFNYRFKKGGGGVAHHFCVKSSSPQLAFVM